MMRRLTIALFLCMPVLMAGRAEALSFPSLHDIVCAGLEVDPYYWAIYGAVVAAKDSGELNSQMDCMDLGDAIGDYMIPTGALKDCICESIGWPPANPPMCSDAHDACTAGVALGASTSMMTCTGTATDDVAAKVCASDSFCCTQQWDSTCASEAGSAFWSAMDAEVQAIVDRMDLTCDQKDQDIATLQVEANADSGQLPCLGTKTYPSNCGTRTYFEFGFAGKCMGVSGGSLTNGTNIIPWSCNAQPPSYTGATDQGWTIDLNDCTTYQGYSYCSVRNGLNYNKCLGTKAGGTGNGTNLVVWDCLGQAHADQYWNVTRADDGFWYFVNLASAEAGGFYGIHENSSTFNLGSDTQSTQFAVTP